MNYIQPPNKQHYYDQVWEVARQIPKGSVATYGQLAKLLPIPEGISGNDYRTCGARWVGLAMAACPDDVPWQRVINSQGRISERPEAGKQKQLLETEGVLFYNGKLDLREYQWPGPGMDNQATQGRLF